MSRAADLTGMKIGRWSVLSAAPFSRNRQRQWNVVCECGNAARVLDCNLTRGLSKQCSDCLRRFGPLTDMALPIMRPAKPAPIEPTLPTIAGRENGAPLPPMHPISWCAISQHAPCLFDAASSTGTHT